MFSVELVLIDVFFNAERALKITFTRKVKFLLEDVATKFKYYVVPISFSFVDRTFNRFP
jgi:hypothetical protein